MKARYLVAAGALGAILPTLIVSELVHPHEPCEPEAEAPCRDSVTHVGSMPYASNHVVCPTGATATLYRQQESDSPQGFAVCSCDGAPDASVPQ